MIEEAVLFRHTLLAHHHVGARGAVGSRNAARTGEKITQRDAHPHLAALLHTLQQLVDTPPMIVLIVAPVRIKRRF